MRVHLIRLAIGLDRRNMPSFIPGAKTLLGKLGTSASSFPALPVSPATLEQQLNDVETVHLQTKTTRGLVPLRTTKVDIFWNALSSDCNYCEGVCQQNPEQGLALASSSGFQVINVGLHARDIITVKIELGKGIAHLLVNTQMLPPPSGRPSAAVTYLWRHSIDGLKTIINDDPTPTGRTTLTGLPLGVDINVGVAVKDSKGVSAWSQWIAFHGH
jgi:hypothetical protein